MTYGEEMNVGFAGIALGDGYLLKGQFAASRHCRMNGGDHFSRLLGGVARPRSAGIHRAESEWKSGSSDYT
ncbi:MAG TPA: hypothetical protein DCP92_01360 [Nitrospiraceae bacterium]|nr:hypothetical protein [Nitrospiraceae bacterium]